MKRWACWFRSTDLLRTTDDTEFTEAETAHSDNTDIAARWADERETAIGACALFGQLVVRHGGYAICSFYLWAYIVFMPFVSAAFAKPLDAAPLNFLAPSLYLIVLICGQIDVGLSPSMPLPSAFWQLHCISLFSSVAKSTLGCEHTAKKSEHLIRVGGG